MHAFQIIITVLNAKNMAPRLGASRRAPFNRSKNSNQFQNPNKCESASSSARKKWTETKLHMYTRSEQLRIHTWAFSYIHDIQLHLDQSPQMCRLPQAYVIFVWKNVGYAVYQLQEKNSCCISWDVLLHQLISRTVLILIFTFSKKAFNDSLDFCKRL